MTDFKKFQEKVRNNILDYMPKEYQNATVDIIHVQKNNDQNQVGMTIKKEGQMVAATVYLEHYYKDFPDNVSDETILQAIAKEYMKAQSERPEVAAMAEFVKDYNSVKDNIRVQLVNKETNRERLRDCPKKEIEGTDLLVAFQILFYENERECAGALVTNGIMDKWNTDLESLYEIALKNTVARAPAQISSVMSMFCEGEEFLEPEDVFSEERKLYILSNPQKNNGAATMLYPGLLQSIAEGSQSDFYILPSSIHEVLLVKRENDMSTKELQCMVMEINRNVVDPKEVLSDQVYFYDGREQKLSMAISLEGTKEIARSMEMFSAGYTGMEAESEEEGIER